jgi:hypothetical protein
MKKVSDRYLYKSWLQTEFQRDNEKCLTSISRSHIIGFLENDFQIHRLAIENQNEPDL